MTVIFRIDYSLYWISLLTIIFSLCFWLYLYGLRSHLSFPILFESSNLAIFILLLMFCYTIQSRRPKERYHLYAIYFAIIFDDATFAHFLTINFMAIQIIKIIVRDLFRVPFAFGHIIAVISFMSDYFLSFICYAFGRNAY